LTQIEGGIEPILFVLNNGPPSGLSIFENLPAGEWEVTAIDAEGCPASFVVILDAPPVLAVELGPSPELGVGDTYAIPVQVNQSGVFNYVWSPPDGLDCVVCPNPVATAFEEITYTLLLTNADGCEALGTLSIRIKESEGSVYVPNIFSPDGDSKNDWLTVFGNPAKVLGVELFQVYDRWGELMFETQSLGLNDEQSGWDGTHRGKKVLPGVYIWRADIRLNYGSLLQKKGEVTVMR